MPTEKVNNPVLVFYSYSHKDEKYRNALSLALAKLSREGAIKEWYDRKISPGQQWADEIDEHLKAAQLILLLISSDFIASDYCYSKEMMAAVKMHETGKARVVPIIVRPWDFSGTPFAKLQALPKDAKAVTIWPNRDQAWLNVLQGITQAVKEIAAGSPSAALTAAIADGVPAPRRARKPRATKTAPTRSKRATKRTAVAEPAARMSPRPGAKLRRTIYDARNGQTLPGKVARREGQPTKNDPAVDEAYEWLGVAYNFFWDVFKRNSVNGKGMPLNATVHYGKGFSNAFWNGKHMIIGDGDGQFFNRFSIAIDVVAKEFANGVVQADTKLTYWEQSGALFNSIACVLAILVKQYALNQTADQADWLHGEGLFTSKVKGVAISSFKAPGTAYNDKMMGKDPQPSSMRHYVKTADDNGGIHINTGIPNHAFYRVAVGLGGYAWERAGLIWYDAMRDKKLKSNARFRDFALLTLAHARRLYGNRSEEAQAVKSGWAKVGINI